MMDKLLPCPFCGGAATVGANEYYDGANTFYIYCASCGVQQMTTKIRTDEAIAAWNRRAEPELTRCEKCDYWDRSASFMSAHACAFWSSGKKTRYTENYDFCSFAERKEECHEGD